MVDSTEQANQLLANITDLKDYFEGQRGTWDGDVVVAQAAYDALGGALVGIVTDRMNVVIDYEPDEAAADLQPDGHFRNWGELMTFAYQLPAHSRITVRLPDNMTLISTSFFVTAIYGPRHWVFKSKTPSFPLGAHTPVFEIGLYDELVYNQYFPFDVGETGSFAAEHVKFKWSIPANPGLPFSSNTVLISYGSHAMVDLRVCEIANNDGLAFARLVTGSIGKMVLHTVTLDGNVMALDQAGSSSIAMVVAGAVTTVNGAVIYDPSLTVGVDLLTN